MEKEKITLQLLDDLSIEDREKTPPTVVDVQHAARIVKKIKVQFEKPCGMEGFNIIPL